MYIEDDLPLPSFYEMFGNGNSKRKSVPNADKVKRSKPTEDTTAAGRWNPEEQKLFLEGIKQYGKDWKRLSTIIKTRSVIQIRTHAQKMFKRSFGFIPLDNIGSEETAGLQNDNIQQTEADIIQAAFTMQGGEADTEIPYGSPQNEIPDILQNN